MDPARISDLDGREYLAYTRTNPDHYTKQTIRCNGIDDDPRHALSTEVPASAVAVYGFSVARDEQGYEATATALLPKEFRKDFMPHPHFG